MSAFTSSTLRVGVIAPLSWRVPPRHYGPWELVTSLMVEGLVERGVEVTLFASADSQTAGRLEAVCPRPYSEDETLDPKVWECLHISHAFEMARQGAFDIVHNHYDFLPLSYSGLVPEVPVVTTIHGFSSEKIVPVYEKYSERSNHYFVSISNADRHPRLKYAATIYHGIELEAFPFSPVADDPPYLLFFGRIHPDKGVAAAIAFARATGLPLKIAGIVQDEAYFQREVEPYLQPGRVDYLGPVGPDQRASLLGGALVLLHLIHFDEPFGLSVVESMACGTPVLAHARGSMTELIENGVNGFLMKEGADAREALAGVAALDRAVVRASVEERFSVGRMAEAYLALYRRILEPGAEGV
ncbi:MAG TPA: glycosyltransferase family 4 protein [Chthoniobacteraceae bacterium]|nr:glycosyltransferase family 4 protein [Chthoniobacteraceae bacterium]